MIKNNIHVRHVTMYIIELIVSQLQNINLFCISDTVNKNSQLVCSPTTLVPRGGVVEGVITKLIIFKIINFTGNIHYRVTLVVLL